MNTQPNPRIVGAALLGFALVAGAYTLANFGKPQTAAPVPVAISNVAAARVPIAVVDADNNGIEDWRDDFVTTEPVVITPEELPEYNAPDTLTGQLGVNFMQSILYARGSGAIGRSDQQVIDDTVNILSKEAQYKLYDTPDISILPNWTDQDIVNYSNGAALAILNNNKAGMENELFILYDVLQSNDEQRLDEIKTLSEVYQKTRDDLLKLSVPGFAVKEHLDLINTLDAMYRDTEAMTHVEEDPAFTLLRLKRYEEDQRGVLYALQNAYKVMEPYGSLFKPEDPALLFVLFSPANLTIQ
ncbi:hypothetical protein KC887_04255 [Candidatus Kaiserbacteria bacterium]|nr:hypothetical protein [Candidatus Kaiserbacteria bacterium]